MKKFKQGIIVFIIFCSFLVSFVYAKETIIESPKVKIIIDGKVGIYNDVPLIVNNKTMLPLREVLTNLGVQNDAEHIIWDNTKKTVTIIKDLKTIRLEVGNKTAYVNDIAITLEVAPIIYSKNNRIYIPARFIAESLGKKVIWDGSTTSVLIVDEISFNETLDILNKSSAAMLLVKKCKINMKYDFNMDDGTEKVAFKLDTDIQMDIVKKSLYMNMAIDMGVIEGIPINISSEVYQVGNTSYTKSTSIFSIDKTWSKADVTEEDVKVFEETANQFAVQSNDILCSGLFKVDSGDPNIIKLKGDVYLDALFNELTDSLSSSLSDGTSSADFNIQHCNIELTFNKTTYELIGMVLDFGATVIDEKGLQTEMEAKMNFIYSELNGNFEIVVPKEVLDSAVAF